jgi:RNA polymerase sigma factor (sigma-70 family)
MPSLCPEAGRSGHRDRDETTNRVAAMGSIPDDDQAFRATYSAHYRAVLTYFARRGGRDDAADLAAEVFTVAWRRRADLPDGDRTLPWLYRVAANVLSNHRRSLRRRTALVDRVRRIGDRAAASVEDEVMRDAADRTVIEAASGLRSSDREILLLAAWEGLTSRQIAERYRISPAAAERRLSRAKRRLATGLERLEEEERRV